MNITSFMKTSLILILNKWFWIQINVPSLMCDDYIFFLCVHLPMFLCMKWDYLRHGIKESWTHKPDHHTNIYIYINNTSYFVSEFMIVIRFHLFYCLHKHIDILRLSIQCLLAILPVLHLNKGSSMSSVHASIERRHCYRVLWPLKSSS